MNIQPETKDLNLWYLFFLEVDECQKIIGNSVAVVNENFQLRDHERDIYIYIHIYIYIYIYIFTCSILP